MSEPTPMALRRTETGRFGRTNRVSVATGLALVGAAALAACSPVPDLPPAPTEPAPAAASATALPPYHIQVGDTLDVRLLLNPELNEEVTVRPDGHISTTAVPDMLAYGRTPSDLANSLRAVYAHDLQIHVCLSR